MGSISLLNKNGHCTHVCGGRRGHAGRGGNGSVNDCMTESHCTFHKRLPCVGNLCRFDVDLVTDTKFDIR